ncbi:hypothetical protein BCR33DRAFT_788175 [Rhizoclosmatium globosum]|uniref:Uncharacterized protein n=1 Tax=Rhizoclosmatium globosum TaxID=329046 RepID=A0A1Y2BXN7_9FUNG|nr:hypothetical protein BCR33DRAFT_788175 [Rhizoclosmatium globosum]|eukprot:ORY39539.1 hypothetical protein BCR33DRAFT_788175 [Rhizoclosmatium globosum]
MQLGPKLAAIAKPRPASPSVYLKGLAIGVASGFGLETLLIKSGYYNIILKSEAKQLLKAQAQEKRETEATATSTQ